MSGRAVGGGVAALRSIVEARATTAAGALDAGGRPMRCRGARQRWMRRARARPMRPTPSSSAVPGSGTTCVKLSAALTWPDW